eukprot:800365-Prorocentrum_minimum.AAC.1
MSGDARRVLGRPSAAAIDGVQHTAGVPHDPSDGLRQKLERVDLLEGDPISAELPLRRARVDGADNGARVAYRVRCRRVKRLKEGVRRGFIGQV